MLVRTIKNLRPNLNMRRMIRTRNDWKHPQKKNSQLKSWIECHFKCCVHIDSRFFNFWCLTCWIETNITTENLKRAVCICRKALLHLLNTCKIIWIIKIQHQAKANARIEEQLPKQALNIFERKGFSTKPEGGKIVYLQITSTKHSKPVSVPQ